MTVKPSWLIDKERLGPLPGRVIEEQRWIDNLKADKILVPDTRLQAIADAYRKNQEGYLQMLLDALTEETK